VSYTAGVVRGLLLMVSPGQADSCRVFQQQRQEAGSMALKHVAEGGEKHHWRLAENRHWYRARSLRLPCDSWVGHELAAGQARQGGAGARGGLSTRHQPMCQAAHQSGLVGPGCGTEVLHRCGRAAVGAGQQTSAASRNVHPVVSRPGTAGSMQGMGQEAA